MAGRVQKSVRRINPFAQASAARAAGAQSSNIDNLSTLVVTSIEKLLTVKEYQSITLHHFPTPSFLETCPLISIRSASVEVCLAPDFPYHQHLEPVFRLEKQFRFLRLSKMPPSALTLFDFRRVPLIESLFIAFDTECAYTEMNGRVWPRTPLRNLSLLGMNVSGLGYSPDDSLNAQSLFFSHCRLDLFFIGLMSNFHGDVTLRNCTVSVSRYSLSLPTRNWRYLAAFEFSQGVDSTQMTISPYGALVHREPSPGELIVLGYRWNFILCPLRPSDLVFAHTSQCDYTDPYQFRSASCPPANEFRQEAVAAPSSYPLLRQALAEESFLIANPLPPLYEELACPQEALQHDVRSLKI